MSLTLGFDAGTQSVKVAIYDENNTCVAQHSEPTTLTYPHPNWVQMNADRYVQLTKNGIRACLQEIAKQGYSAHDVKAIMGDGIICGIVGINAQGKAITPYINYLDSRTMDDVEAINATENPIWAKETGNAQASPMFPAMHARWFLRNNEAFQKDGVKFVHNAPYILMRLIEAPAQDAFIDWGALSGWGLGYKIREKVWSDEQLSILGIDRSYLPRIVKPWDIMGGVSPAVAAETGLIAGTPVLAGAGDTMQSMLGAGIFGPNMGVDVAGTCAMFCVSTNGIIPALSQPGMGLIFNSGSLPNTYFYWGFVRTGGLALRWFKDQICRGEDDPTYYRHLSTAAKDVPAGSNGVLFLPYLTGGYGEEKEASACFLNMTLDTNEATLWRSVLEAIAFDYQGLAAMYRKAGIDLTQLTVTEGGSRDDLWNQIKSNMIDTEIIRYRNAGGAVLTNAIFARWALRQKEDFDALRAQLAAAIEENGRYQPDEKTVALYKKVAALRSRLITQHMKSSFHALTQLRDIVA